MCAGGAQGTPKIDEALSVELEFLDSGASDSRDPDDLFKVSAPSKMTAPSISPRMEEGQASPGGGICGVHVRVFETVTAVT